jgi:hypothetical protein
LNSVAETEALEAETEALEAETEALEADRNKPASEAYTIGLSNPMVRRGLRFGVNFEIHFLIIFSLLDGL